MKRPLVIAAVTALVIGAFAMPAAISAHPHGSYDNSVIGTSGDDVLEGTDGMDRMLGKGGDDRIDGGKGRDMLRGGSGDDIITGGNLHDELRGGVGEDKLTGGSGNDVLLGGRGKDRLFGGPGDDVLRASGDGSRDLVDCGGGTSDRAIVDARDLVTGCEIVKVVGQ